MVLRKYLEFSKVAARTGMAYKTNSVMRLLTSVFYLAFVYYIWRAISASGSLSAGLGEIMAYIVLSQTVISVANINVENFFGERIRDGTITNELKRPISLRLQTYFHFLGLAGYRIVVRGLPIFLLGVLVFNVGFPAPTTLLIFIFSVFMSFNLIFGLSYLFAMFVFWTKSDWSIRMTRNNLQNIFSGAIFPLFLLPDSLRTLFNLTPFPSMVDTPVSIYRASITGKEMFEALGIQFIWTVVLLLLGALVWRKAKTKLTVQGG